MNKPELLACAGSYADVKAYMEAGADAVIVGESRYGMRLPGDMNLEAIAEATAWAHARGAKIYVSVNNIMDNKRLGGLAEYVRAIAEIGVDGALFGDPAVLMAARDAAPTLKLHWNAEMTSTNYVTANYWGDKGASRVVLARELNLDEVLEFKLKCKLPLEVQVHGMMNIYHSKRSLVGSYTAHRRSAKEHRGGGHADAEQSGDVNASMERGLYLIEAERPNERFPIYQDDNGTHIMSSDDMCVLEDLHELLAAGVDSLRIETLLKPLAYNVAVIRGYPHAVDAFAPAPEGYPFDQSWLDEIRSLQDPERELSFGFFYKEQVY